MLEQNLRSTGLTQNEARVYIYLLQNGEASPSQIAKGTGIQRTNSYNVLRTLKEKGLIEAGEKRKKEVFFPINPTALLRRAEQEKESVAALLPDLQALYGMQTNKPSVRFFNGLEAVNYEMQQSPFFPPTTKTTSVS